MRVKVVSFISMVAGFIRLHKFGAMRDCYFPFV